MKRQTAMALAAVFTMSVAGIALAAPANPFVDVPAKHWAYDSIDKLAQAGVISGYGDGTFQGDKTLTRYEVATIVAKAMANSDKADAASKKEIEALKAEFGEELDKLGVRVDNLEKNASKVKFTGEVRERYKAESEWGTSANSKLVQAYITGKASGLDYSLGRQPIWLGQGLLADIEGNCDGLLVSGGKDIKVAVGAFKTTGTNYYYIDDISGNFQTANIDAKVNDNLHVSLSYLKMDDDFYGISAYKSTSVGLNYTGIKNFTVSGEYGQNDSDGAKGWNGVTGTGDKPKAWMAKIQYAGAKKDKVGSFGAWVGYRNADSGFDLFEFTTLDSARRTNTDSGYYEYMFGELDNVKGAEFGIEYTVFRNGIFTLQYNDLELKDDYGWSGIEKDKKNFFAQLEYSF
ncbi:MAG: S-layer protein [Firmicutes bacterium]|nr:S-layer protein [Bacillota bacterium]